MSDKTLHMIGNAHLDPVWLWQWPEGFQEVTATFRSVLDLMKECEHGHDPLAAVAPCDRG